MGTFIPCLLEYENQLFKNYKDLIRNRNLPIIAIGGFSGTGKDTVAKFVQEYFQREMGILLKISSAGDFVRKIAKESGYEEKRIDEFMKFIKETQNQEFAQKVDIEIEKKALKQALLTGGIFVGRMAPFAIGTHGITIWLEVSARIIAQRLSQDKFRSEYGMNQNELVKRIKSRDETDGMRLEEIYGISFRDKKNFDLVLRNEGFSINELKSIIKKLLISKNK